MVERAELSVGLKHLRYEPRYRYWQNKHKQVPHQ